MATPSTLTARLLEPGGDTITVSTDAWRRELIWQATGQPQPGRSAIFDAAAIALTPLAQARGWALRLEGAVDSDLLAQLEEYQGAFATLHPEIYKRVRVSSASATEAAVPSGGRRAVLSFSGGVDSVWSLVANQTGAFDHRTTEIEVAVQFHGLDLRFDDADAHRRAAIHAEAIAAAFDVRFATVATNWREQFTPNYTRSFAAGIAAGLRRFAGIADMGILTLDSMYGQGTVGWGSTPSTNSLLGSRQFPIRSVGGDLSRLEKIAAIAQYPVVRQHVRSCWEGTDLAGENCGRCEKCLRTMVGFAAVGYRHTDAFGHTEATPVRSIRARTLQQLGYLEELRGGGLDLDLEHALEEVIGRSRQTVEVADDQGAPP